MGEKQNLLISFSGGRTSAMMTKYLLDTQKDKYNMIVVFANTGREREETLEFVDRCDKDFGFNLIWVEAFVHNKTNVGTTHVITDFKNAERNGEPFEDVIAKYGIPNQNTPHCSRELKRNPIRSYAKSIGWKKYSTILGIRTDEPKRLNWEKSKKERLLYFAQFMNVTKSDVNYFWSKQTFDLRLKSYEGNCDLCWKKSKRKLLTILKYNPELSQWWIDMEIKYEMFTPQTRIDKGAEEKIRRFYRGELSILDLQIMAIEDSFEDAIDESNLIDTTKQLSLWDEELDSNGGCIESCEAF